MGVKYGKIEMPKEIKLEKGASDTFGRFVAEPFERGFGHTVGHALRRMLLSSLESPAIIGIRIEGVPHEYVAIEGVVEDMVDIILNLKGALLRRLPTEDTANVLESRMLNKFVQITQEQLDKGNGQYTVTLGDVVEEGLFEVVNPNLKLFTVTQPFERRIDLRVAFGRGYVPSERIEVRDRAADEILIDGSFSPIRLVNYLVEKTRVGQDTDFDRLILEITTDGRITPKEALSFVAQIGLKHFEIFDKVSSYKLDFEKPSEGEEGINEEILEKLSLGIDEIELSVRSTNCLTGANIETIAELVSVPERKMLEFRNFGKKSLTEIKEKLEEMGLSLGMNLSRYGITSENVKERMKRARQERLEERMQQQQKEEEDQ